MRRIMVVFCCLTILPFVSAGGDPGVDTGPEIEGTSIAEIQYSKATNEGDVWEITMKLNEDAAGNNTTIKGESQICINAGSCLAPQYLEFTQNSELYWEASLIAKGLDEIQGIEINPDDVETNIINFRVQGMTKDELIEKLNKQGTHVLPKDSITIRAVTNLMVSESQINIALDHVRNAMKS